MKTIRILLSAVLTVLLLTGCAVGSSDHPPVESDPDTRALTERMAELYQRDFTLISEDIKKGITTLQDENGLQCHVRRYLDDFDRRDGSLLEIYCDDYYAVLVGETPEMKMLREKRGAYLKSSLTGEYDETGRCVQWMIGCENYDDLADIYRETVTAAANAPSMTYGQQGHWNTLLPYLTLAEPHSGAELATTGAIGDGSLNRDLAAVQDAFTEQLYRQGRRNELPEAAIRQCPQSGQLREDQLSDLFGITLEIDPLKMTGTARFK